MLRSLWPLLIALVLALCGCAPPGPAAHAAVSWTTGFWFWQGSSTEDVRSQQTLDVLFVHLGAIGGYASLPERLPPAREYWLVFRYERQRVPDLGGAPALAERISEFVADAQAQDLHVAGVQLDVDSPTGALAEYARYLREVRKGLPAGCQVSITALLDWFRSGTAIAEVIRAVDEFVPQFYDVGDSQSTRGEAVAAPVDAARWGPVFNRFGKRFRVGISTFGRARMMRSSWFADLAPIDIAVNRAFTLQASHNAANELVLTYRAIRKVRVGYNEFDPGQTFQFILATPEAIYAAVESVRQMRGRVTGVVFFRWPSSDEKLTMQPDEVLSAAGGGPAGGGRNRIQVVDGRCAAVSCVDVYLESAAPFSAHAVRYRIRTSHDLEYFLPEKNMPVRMSGASELELALPAYCGRGRLYVGRAVSAEPVEFTVEEES